MARLLRISEIHEFAEVGGIPRAVVTNDIRSNVALLDERTQLEPWIQDIIRSHDQTPHGPTEIADILPTSVTVSGAPKYTAFILKGKGTQKVTSKQVGHQFLKLYQLEGLELAVLLAVGDIQDDAKRDFIITARNIGCDFLVIPRDDVARLLIAYDKICEKDGLPFEDHCCPKGHPQQREVLLKYKIREEFQSTLFKPRNLSHAAANRYSVIVLTDKHYTHDAIRTILTDVLHKFRTDEFVRSEILNAQGHDISAQVVWMDVAYDLDDVNRCNWVCMACWIDPNLDEKFRPHWSDQYELHNDIMIDWNSSYHARKSLWSQYTGGKNDVVKYVEKILDEMHPILESLVPAFMGFQERTVEESHLMEVIAMYKSDARDIYFRGSKCPLPPPDCEDYRQQFMNAICFFDNLFLYFSVVGPNVWTTKRVK